MHEQFAPNHGYPSNVNVHGNGFIQIDLGGSPETRIHIWDQKLKYMCQKVNTDHHNHRFGFVSLILHGQIEQHELMFSRVADEDFLSDAPRWTRWEADGNRTATGNRMLVERPGDFVLMNRTALPQIEGNFYIMPPVDYHHTELLSERAVTLLTKTVVLPEDEFQASIMCLKGSQPDQSYNRYQIPWDQLLSEHIQPALAKTPFAKAEIFR